uniref:Uncharacterized protein n=1 Tax=Anabas testudineus TaxID=64144 RepID=A0A3Q1IZR9_ANATE
MMFVSGIKLNCQKKSIVNIVNSVHESTVLKTLNRSCIYNRTSQMKPLLSIAACLKFAKGNHDTQQHYWENVSWT